MPKSPSHKPDNAPAASTNDAPPPAPPAAATTAKPVPEGMVRVRPSAAARAAKLKFMRDPAGLTPADRRHRRARWINPDAEDFVIDVDPRGFYREELDNGELVKTDAAAPTMEV